MLVVNRQFRKLLLCPFWYSPLAFEKWFAAGINIFFWGMPISTAAWHMLVWISYQQFTLLVTSYTKPTRNIPRWSAITWIRCCMVFMRNLSNCDLVVTGHHVSTTKNFHHYIAGRISTLTSFSSTRWNHLLSWGSTILTKNLQIFASLYPYVPRGFLYKKYYYDVMCLRAL